MADLASKTTDGRLSFIKYVTDNKRYAEIEFEIEKGKSSFLYVKSGSSLKSSTKEFKAGTKFKIVDTKSHDIAGIKYALCKIGSTTGLIPINRIRKPTGGNGTQYEDEVVDLINKVILKNGPIDIKLKGDSVLYKSIAYAVKVDSNIKRSAGVKGDPKADIILCKDIKKPLDKGSIYVSHKKEGGPEAFQQYGGISEQSGAAIYSHPLVQKFLKLTADFIGDAQQLPAPVMGTFKNDNLACMSIFGPDYGKPFSIDHTQLIGQGKPELTPKNGGKYFELDFTSHMSLSGDLRHFGGGYAPVFGGTFRAGRSFVFKGKRYNGARLGIYPIKLIQSRAGLLTLVVK